MFSNRLSFFILSNIYMIKHSSLNKSFLTHVGSSRRDLRQNVDRNKISYENLPVFFSGIIRFRYINCICQNNQCNTLFYFFSRRELQINRWLHRRAWNRKFILCVQQLCQHRDIIHHSDTTSRQCLLPNNGCFWHDRGL